MTTWGPSTASDALTSWPASRSLTTIRSASTTLSLSSARSRLSWYSRPRRSICGPPTALSSWLKRSPQDKTSQETKRALEMNMRTQKFICTLLLALASCATGFAQKQTPPEGGPPKPFKLPQKQTFALANGVQVTMVPYGEIPKVTVNVTVRAGNLNENAEQVWLADLTGQMIKEGGTATRSAQQVAEEAASMGGSV